MNSVIKYVLFAIATVPAGLKAQDPQQFRLEASIKKLATEQNNKAVLMHMLPGKMVFDTVDVVNGTFVITGTAPAKQKAFLYVTHGGIMPQSIGLGDNVPVYLENGTIKVTAADSLKHAKVGGTPLNNDQQALVDLLAPIQKKVDVLEIQYAAANSSEDSLQSAMVRMRYEALEAKKDSAVLGFVKAHPASLVSLLSLRSYFDPATKIEKATAGFDLLDPALKASSQGQLFGRMIKRATVLDIGGEAPAFTAANTAGENISLKSFRGKYVLVDFWASWCVPCRHENPNVVKAFNRFKDKNFTIVGFSLDEGNDGKEKWLKAIEKDGLPWMQLSDLAGWASPVAMLYNLKAIPANFLLDPSGKIVAKNLRGEELEQKLEEVFGKS
ncbi:TlpA disulfide reductase family protein [Chitinophaga sancti]|uniref:Peroxiredoxin n=1 Tax=Chitinophaga sancti TaxID=1004 RepID=A0A1K1SJT1_9BACT|nr:TlpA disulfide reductase family protein [Chitinophaga sancti]WQD64500.1 TlpA disulfide reductase family protein [Chitinophaga sancti]WQG89876.1 TlpA disulfide reductase family protein [Chitinophaga sancti]SFW84530.1 Peroxiredoxin [Chitinophaga sancti]